MGIARAIVITAVLLTGACALVSTAPDNSIEAQALRDACRLSGYDCRGVKPPAITYSTRMGSALGKYYPGMRTVFLRTELDPVTDKLAYAVLVHEVTHYIQWRVYGWENVDKFMACSAETDAFRVSNALLIELGLPDETYEDWAIRYRC